jgi:hypothetical protein
VKFCKEQIIVVAEPAKPLCFGYNTHNFCFQPGVEHFKCMRTNKLGNIYFSMKNIDFETFKNNTIWFIRPNDFVEVFEGELEVSKACENTFPTLTKLIKKSRILNLKKNNSNYKLLSWDNDAGKSCGWLIAFESQDVEIRINLLPEHDLLLRTIGGLVETYNPTDGFLSNSMNFMFVKSKCFSGIGSAWSDFYQLRCLQESSAPLQHENFVIFAAETGGHYVMYDLNNKRVYMFDTDPGLPYLEEIKGQPQATFYTINGAPTFTDYVELLARQWLEWVV